MRRTFGTGLAINGKNRVAKRRFNSDQPSPSYRSNWLTETIGSQMAATISLGVVRVPQCSPIASQCVLNLA
jgi:hypothetical protein